MQGLLGTSIDDPRTLGLLQMAAALSSGRKFMPALAQGLLARQQVVQGAADAEEAKKDRAMRRGLLDMQIKEQQQQAERRQGIDAAYRNAFRTPEQMAMGANGGPTLAAAQAAPGMAPGFDQNALLRGLAQADPQAAFGMMQPKPADYKVVGDALLQVGPGGVKEAYRAPAKPEAMPSAVREYQFAQQQGYKGTFQQYQIEKARAGATNLSVNTGERIPEKLVKLQDEMLDRTLNATAIDKDLGAVQGQIQSGKLQFGPVENLVNTSRNMLGISNEQSRAFGSFKSTLEKLRNDSLRLNAGVQTDGDAQRAWNELFQNINDTQFVNERLTEIRRINQRGAELQRYRLNVLRRNSGAGELELPQVEPALGSGGGALTPAEQQELNELRARLGGR